jgi:hypothetical protein
MLLARARHQGIAHRVRSYSMREYCGMRPSIMLAALFTTGKPHAFPFT